jgi:hypothetical protein
MHTAVWGEANTAVPPAVPSPPPYTHTPKAWPSPLSHLEVLDEDTLRLLDEGQLVVGVSGGHLASSSHIQPW